MTYANRFISIVSYCILWLSVDVNIYSGYCSISSFTKWFNQFDSNYSANYGCSVSTILQLFYRLCLLSTDLISINWLHSETLPCLDSLEVFFSYHKCQHAFFPHRKFMCELSMPLLPLSISYDFYMWIESAIYRWVFDIYWTFRARQCRKFQNISSKALKSTYTNHVVSYKMLEMSPSENVSIWIKSILYANLSIQLYTIIIVNVLMMNAFSLQNLKDIQQQMLKIYHGAHCIAFWSKMNKLTQLIAAKNFR